MKDNGITDDKNQDSDEVWKKLLRESIVSPNLLPDNLKNLDLTEVCKKYPMRLNSYYLSLIKEKGDSIYLQSIPSMEEITDNFGEEDPLCEEPEHQERKNVPSLITHRYSDRALFLISNQCPVYCRHCTRKRKVDDPKRQPQSEEIEQAINYIKNNSEITDVILSGGDPFTLVDSRLEKILKPIHEIMFNRLDKYGNSGIVRIGTRVPVTLPQRITPDLCKMLEKYTPNLHINTHFNHPLEITSESKKACIMLERAGIPLGNQTVLLKGVNDNSETLKYLFKGLINFGVIPYYLYVCDPVKGVNHFRIPVQKALEIYNSLAGNISGKAVPKLVIDAPGGGGKVQISPENIIKMNDEEVLLRNREGKLFKYPQVKIREK